MALRRRELRAGQISVLPVWFDSLGAKSSCVLIRTPDVRILVDPGAASMQPSYPLPGPEKERLKLKAYRAIEEAAGKADVVVITHYHYDHHVRFDFPVRADVIYGSKLVLAKDPNRYINKSQWERARLLYAQMCERLGGERLEEFLARPGEARYPDPMSALPLASARDFGDYQARREELLERGRRWFEKLARELWSSKPWVPELELGRTSVRFVDGSEVEFGRTIVRFPGPLFHGVEFARVGWVISLVVERGDAKLVYTSDLQGPVIEDYADWLVREDPDVLILDGPPTYLLGYMMNKINLQRAVENIKHVVEATRTDPIILDHHLLREPRYAERLADVYEVAKRVGKRVLTVAEWFGRRPLVLEAAGAPRRT